MEFNRSVFYAFNLYALNKRYIVFCGGDSETISSGAGLDETTPVLALFTSCG